MMNIPIEDFIELRESQEALNLESDILLKKNQIYKLVAEIYYDAIRLKEHHGYSEEKIKELVQL